MTIKTIVQHSNFLEAGISYARSDGKQVDMTLLRADAHEPAKFCIGIYANKKADQAEQLVELSLAEARMLRAVLNSGSVLDILEQDEQHLQEK